MQTDFMNFDQGGIQIEGTWINKNTGQKIFVRDSFIDGDDMVIRTVDGTILSMNEFSNNYIQMDDEEVGTAMPSVAPTNYSNNIPYAFDENDNDVEDIIKPDFGTIKKPSEPSEYVNQQIETKQSNTTNDLVKKLFDKIDSKPVITIDIDWADFPKEQLNMMMTYFDVTLEDVSKYLMQNYVNEKSVELVLQNTISDRLM